MLFTAAELQRITSTPAFVLLHAMKPGAINSTELQSQIFVQAPCVAVIEGYYKNGDCTVDFVHNPSRNASQDINIAAHGLRYCMGLGF